MITNKQQFLSESTGKQRLKEEFREIEKQQGAE